MDGTDCRILEPTPFSAKWYSHKFNGPGVRYEVGVRIADCMICWVHGPFPAGKFPDQKIFSSCLQQKLFQTREFIVADGGYRGAILSHGITDAQNDLIVRIRARHETVNGRLKNFRCLSHAFRHDLSKHGICFFAVVNLRNLMLAEGHEHPFPLHYQTAESVL